MHPALDQLKLSAIDVAANGIVITDTSGSILWVNQGFCELTGYSREEALGRNPRLLKSGQQAPDFYHHLWSTITSGNIWHGELTNRKKDGSTYIEEMTITPIKNDSGEVTNFVAVKQDVSAKKAAQALADQNRILLDSVVQNLPIMVSVKTAASLKYVLLNKTGTQLLGITESEFLNQTDSDLFPPDQAVEFTRHDREVLSSRQTADIPQHVIQSKTLGQRTLHTRKVPIFDGSGQPEYLLCVSEDITDTLAAQHELKEKIHELEQINQIMVDRELKMIELKAELAQLKSHEP